MVLSCILVMRHDHTVSTANYLDVFCDSRLVSNQCVLKEFILTTLSNSW